MSRRNRPGKYGVLQAVIPIHVHHLRYMERWGWRLLGIARARYRTDGRGALWLTEAQTHNRERCEPEYRNREPVPWDLLQLIRGYDPETQAVWVVQQRGGISWGIIDRPE